MRRGCPVGATFLAPERYPKGETQSRRTHMADNKANRGEPDRSRINLKEDYEVRYWTERFGLTKHQLEKAIEKVGNTPEEVARLLGRAA